MKGRIKFVDAKTGLWGFIAPEDSTKDVHFALSDFVGVRPIVEDAEAEVEFELVEDSQGRHAKSIRFVDPPVREPSTSVAASPGDALTTWAFVPFIPFEAKDHKKYSSALELLDSITLEEKWHFGENPNPERPFPILENYIKYTFYKLQCEEKVEESSDGHWAIFNTGLVDKLYDPIFAMFEKNTRDGAQPWYFFDFCVPGKGGSGKRLTSVFAPLPGPASYFTDSTDMLLDVAREMHVDYEHVIFDGLRRDRFPIELLRRHVPDGFTFEEYGDYEYGDRIRVLYSYADALEQDLQTLRALKWRLEDAKNVAQKRTRWNYKTAIPQYYPRRDILSFLLPLAIVRDQVVDVALVVTRNPSGSYQGRTVLPLDWAYQNARLICRPDSDWLTPQSVSSEKTPVEEGEVEEGVDVGAV
jgi:cold shock CspA family protein